MSLVVAPCSHEAAKHAVMSWHYSKRMPAGKLVAYGAWEGRFVGAVIYGRGATPKLGSPYGLDATEVCELVRVALADGHESPTSQVVSQTLRLMKANNPNMRLVVSFADTQQGHRGGIYQAGNWIYAGSVIKCWISVNGELHHPRSLGAKYGVGGQSIPWLQQNVDADARNVELPPKHRYLYPLDRAMRRQVQALALPYPSADEGSTVSRDTSGDEVQVRPLPSAQAKAG